MTPASGADSSPSIRSSLLGDVQQGKSEAWSRFVDIFGPVIYDWCRKHGLPPCDAEDVAQEVLCQVFKKIPEFVHDKTFRGWLWRITKHKIIDRARHHNREPRMMDGSKALRMLLEAPDEAAIESIEEPSAVDTDRLAVRRALATIQRTCEEHIFQAFWRTTVLVQPTADVARDLGMTVEAVRQARCRILQRLRRELEGLLSSSSTKGGQMELRARE